MNDPQPGDIVRSTISGITLVIVDIQQSFFKPSKNLYYVFDLDAGRYTWYNLNTLGNGNWEIAA